jgi:hypothetical protein
MKKITLFIQLIQNMGIRYFIYRFNHEIEKRLKLVKAKHPVAPIFRSFISKDDFLKKDNFILSKTFNFKNQNPELKIKAEKILSGEILFFNHEWKNIGSDYDWITNPETRFKYDSNKHWSEINDFNLASGDIKFVWEKSRFSYLLTIMRYDYHHNEDHAKFVFEEIESWIDANPINQGPNWKCSQEISLRVFNWSFLLDYYKQSVELTEERWNKIQHVIYWSLHHVYRNINFSRIAVRNNHAITETLFLALSELMFPFIPETKLWSKKGRVWLEQEIDYQIYDDGTYLQFSMNYHRVVIQLLSLGISVSEKNKKPFSKVLYQKAYKSLDFLYQCLQNENGKLPNYGSNDGALFFPLSDLDYRDYRPQLNNLHLILTGKQLFDNLETQEDSQWISASYSNSSFLPLEKKFGAISYPIGGFFILRDEESFSMIRCGKHLDRPAQADNLHLDVWVKGENVLRDSGTYKYNTEKKYSDYFTGTISHNTVTIGEKSQMLKGSRFIWYYWSQSLKANVTESEKEFIFEGKISAFRFLNKNIVHQRKIKKIKNQLSWIVEDEINAMNPRQNWHFGSSLKPFFKSSCKEKVTFEKEFDSYDSSYYGAKVDAKSIYFDFEDKIQTEINIK